jgi:hypothetical protein
VKPHRHLSSVALALALALSLSACGKKDADKAPADKDKAAAKADAKDDKKKKDRVTLPELAPESPRTKVADVPVPEDFEEEAAKTVSVENLEVELDRLEAEISAE